MKRTCPRCGLAVARWQAVHIPCMLERLRFWLLGAAALGLAIGILLAML